MPDPASGTAQAAASPDPQENPVKYLRSIYAPRQQCKAVWRRAQSNGLHHFDLALENMPALVSSIVALIKRDFGDQFTNIPPHGRWQHFDAGGVHRIDELLTELSNVPPLEQTRLLLDLFLVSVLLDAGAGNTWAYTSPDGTRVSRSEGIAVASLAMFRGGAFSSDSTRPLAAHGPKLQSFTASDLAAGFQVTPANAIEGLQGRAELLATLGAVLQSKPAYFGSSARPGGLIDYLLAHPSTRAEAGKPVFQLTTLWDALQDALVGIWPPRHALDGQALGDCWPCGALGAPSVAETQHGAAAVEYLVPFHKLTQWLTYSLMPIATKLLGARFEGVGLMTGLPEYRNGGLFVDHGVLRLRDADRERGLRAFRERGGDKAQEVPMFDASDDVIIEWRALTVCLLDLLGEEVNKVAQRDAGVELSLAQVLEAGSWKGGREIAARLRPETNGPPIGIISDGTVF